MNSPLIVDSMVEMSIMRALHEHSIAAPTCSKLIILPFLPLQITIFFLYLQLFFTKSHLSLESQ